MLGSSTSEGDLLGRLVAAPSPNPPANEEAVCAVIEEELATLGLPTPESYSMEAGRPNLVLRVGDGPPSGLLIAGHTDTMPPGAAAEWDSDPYELVERGGRLYGLGVADMKVGIAAMIHVAARLRDLRDASVMFVFSADEEAGSARGMHYLARVGVIDDARDAVLLEPGGRQRSWDTFYVGQRGSCTAWLVAHGRPGHSGMDVPAEERASWALARAITAVQDARLFADLSHPIEETRPVVNVGTMLIGSDSPWVYPSTVRAAIDVRTIEGMTREVVYDAVQNVLACEGLAARVEIVPHSPPADWFDPGAAVTDGPLYDAAAIALRQTVGATPPHGLIGGTTDASHLYALGIRVLPALGPGTLGVAHRPNESIEVHDLGRGVDLLEMFVRAYLDRRLPSKR